MEKYEKQLMAILVPLTAQFSLKGIQVTTAESCTGGMIAEALTRLPGSSAWFDRGFVTYTNESKHEMLGVAPEVFATVGAVSQACVEQMAVGALKNSQAQMAVAVSGIAGPSGGTEFKPVGTVWIAWAVQLDDEQLRVWSEQSLFSGNRTQIREQACLSALKGLCKQLGM